MHRRELEDQLDTGLERTGMDGQVLEPTEREQVRNRISHGAHRQRLADSRFHSVEQPGVIGAAPLDLHPDRRDAFAQVVINVGAGARSWRKHHKHRKPGGPSEEAC